MIDEMITDIFGDPKTGAGRRNDVRTASDEEFLKKSADALKALEEIRLEKLKIYQRRKKIAIPLAWVAAPFCLISDYLLLIVQHASSDSFAGVTILVMGAIYAWATHPRRQYAKAYKTEILPRIAGLFGNFTYSVDGKIDMNALMPSKIVPGHNRYSSEDYFTGEYKGITLEFSEITLKQKSGSGKNSNTTTKFKGLAVLLNTKHKRFFGHTILDRNSSALSQWFKEKTNKLERADMVDPEFEKIFDAYTNDQVEARYLIDPLMIERLKGIYQEYKGDKMAAAFFDNKMLIMIDSNHNHFEPANIHTPATSPDSILSMKREIGQILSIIDKLSLYDAKAVHERKMAAAVA